MREFSVGSGCQPTGMQVHEQAAKAVLSLCSNNSSACPTRPAPAHSQKPQPTGRPLTRLTMWGITPPPAMVALISVSSSSSPRMASCKWRGVIRFTLRSLEALPASSSTCRGGPGAGGRCGCQGKRR